MRPEPDSSTDPCSPFPGPLPSPSSSPSPPLLPVSGETLNPPSCSRERGRSALAVASFSPAPPEVRGGGLASVEDLEFVPKQGLVANLDLWILWPVAAEEARQVGGEEQAVSKE